MTRTRMAGLTALVASLMLVASWLAWPKSSLTRATCNPTPVPTPPYNPSESTYSLPYAKRNTLKSPNQCAQWPYICYDRGRDPSKCELIFPNGNTIRIANDVYADPWSRDNQYAAISYASSQYSQRPVQVWDMINGIQLAKRLDGYGYIWLDESPHMLGYVELEYDKITGKPVKSILKIFDVDTGDFLEPVDCSSWFSKFRYTWIESQPIPIQCK